MLAFVVRSMMRSQTACSAYVMRPREPFDSSVAPKCPLACAPSNRTLFLTNECAVGLNRQHATARARPIPSTRLLSGLAALRTRPCASPQSNRKRCANLCQRHLQLRLLVDEWDLPVWSTTRVEVNTGGGGRRRWSDAREGRLSGNFTLVSGPKPSQIWLDRSSIWWMPN